AGLFVSYAAQRPTLVADWREGRDTDGCGNPVAGDLAWQAELWRRLVDRVAATDGVVAPDVRHTQTVESLRAGELAGLELPPRLSLFGHTRLPATEVALLRALGEQRDVHLWLPQASEVLWDQLTELSVAGPVPRRLDRSVDLVRHPLLASLGRDARELQRALAQAPSDGLETTAAHPPRPATSLLGWLQDDLRNNRAPEDAARDERRHTPDDRSIQVHACHGATRQIDVLREVLVGLLEDDPTLEPRDIVVMCPDVETYAPLISAGFGLVGVAEEGHPAHRLRVRLADRALSSTNPLLATAGSLVELAGSRVTATEVLDLAGTAAVRQRFGFTDDDLDQIALWVGQAGIRWGIDSHHRAGYGLTLGDNTWLAGMSRILLGVALAEDDHRHVGGTLPIDDVPSGDIDLAGRLIELLDRLNTFVRATESAGRVDEWMAALSAAVTQIAAVPTSDAWQVAEFDRELARMGAAAKETAADDHAGARLRLADVRALLAHRLGGRPTRANFRTGTLTVCTLVPMRSVPHRVVCLIGLDDGVFPRTTSIDGDDVLAREPLTGEREIRSVDRQLLLDAVMATGETLVITYTGANEHTGAERPPAVPLGELLDSIDRTTPIPLRDRVVVRHPLQPFDQRNLVTPGLAGDRPFSFDRASLAGAEAARRPRATPGPLLAGPLPSRPVDDVALTDLHAFFGHPVRTFLRARLDVSAPLSHEETLDAIPIDLDALEKWAVGDRLLSDILAGADPVSGLTAEQLRGLLPPAELGRRTLREVVEKLRPIVEQALPLREG
ncbi:exodeoxyribonuclease V subunit gamma, partial [Nocardioides sp.]|uniref:exodeoxyribonuclease V subunit gamma n=1 Tax=Nocardioides sp. TaxID=35761 RepID=UPI002734C018